MAVGLIWLPPIRQPCCLPLLEKNEERQVLILVAKLDPFAGALLAVGGITLEEALRRAETALAKRDQDGMD